MTRAVIAAAFALSAAACSGGKPVPAPAGTPPAAGAASEGVAGEFGVPECDHFAGRYLACLDKVPEGGRALARQTFEQTIEHWRLVASNPERRATLAAACAQQEKATRAAMSRYDCDW
jgi:hypothetical protein